MKTRFSVIGAPALALLLGIAAMAADEKAKDFAPIPTGPLKTPKKAQAQADLTSLLTALQTYKMMTGQFPNEKQGLASLVTQPTAPPTPKRWIPLRKQLPKDPWGRDYHYVRRVTEGKDGYVLYSQGEDVADPADDLTMPVTDVNAPAAK